MRIIPAYIIDQMERDREDEDHPARIPAYAPLPDNDDPFDYPPSRPSVDFDRATVWNT